MKWNSFGIGTHKHKQPTVHFNRVIYSSRREQQNRENMQHNENTFHIPPTHDEMSTYQSVCWSSMTSRILGLRMTGLGGWLLPVEAPSAAVAADLACAAAAMFWAIWALFTTLEKELRKLPVPEVGAGPDAGLGPGVGALGGCRLSVAGEAGEEVDEPGGVGLCRSIM